MKLEDKLEKLRVHAERADKKVATGWHEYDKYSRVMTPDVALALIAVAQAANSLLDYWKRNGAINIQYEKLADHIRSLAKAIENLEVL